MTSLFLACAGIGASVLAIQIALSLIGIDHGSDVDGEFHAGDGDLEQGLGLLSVRSVAAAVAFFGLGGLAALSLGISALPATIFALVPASVALAGTALLMRQFLRLESSGSLQLERAVGAPATVYLAIPDVPSGAGKVHVNLQGRTVELQAVSSSGVRIPTGATVVVVSVVDPDTVEVVPTSIVEEVLDEQR